MMGSTTAPVVPVYDQWIDAVDALVRVGLEVQVYADHGQFHVRTPDGTRVGEIVARVDHWAVVWL